MTQTFTNETLGFNDAFPIFRTAEGMKAFGAMQVELALQISNILIFSDKKKMTATEIAEALKEKFGDIRTYRKKDRPAFSVQRVSAFLGKLMSMGLVQREVVKTGEMITIKTRDGKEKEIEKVITLFSHVE